MSLILRVIVAIVHLLLIILLIDLIGITFNILINVQYERTEKTTIYCHKKLYQFTVFISIFHIINAPSRICRLMSPLSKDETGHGSLFTSTLTPPPPLKNQVI